jgi:putative addiction module component (TIGR02574 family)
MMVSQEGRSDMVSSRRGRYYRRSSEELTWPSCLSIFEKIDHDDRDNKGSAVADEQRRSHDQGVMRMSPKTESVMKEALQLPREARALIAEKLLESLDFEEPFEISNEWKEEIARRCREIDDGTAELIPGDRVLKEAAEGIEK